MNYFMCLALLCNSVEPTSHTFDSPLMRNGTIPRHVSTSVSMNPC